MLFFIYGCRKEKFSFFKFSLVQFYTNLKKRLLLSPFPLLDILPDTFVPFLDYKEKQQQWQWIGSGRDSDEQMYGLCQQWLENKDDITSDILETCQGSPPPPRV